MIMMHWMVSWHAPTSLDRRENGTALVYASSGSEARKKVREVIGPWGADTMIPDSARLAATEDIEDWGITSLDLDDAKENGVHILEWGT